MRNEWDDKRYGWVAGGMEHASRVDLDNHGPGDPDRDTVLGCAM